MTAAWHVVVPVKPAAVGKSRLGGSGRAALAEAIARDTVEAACRAVRVCEVVVVTADGAWADDPASRVRVVHETAPAGLGPAIRAGLATVAGDRPRAVLLGDLPALRPADLDAALGLAEAVPLGLVPDAEGTGSTLVTARAGAPLEPAFGPGSATRHRAAGFVELEIAATSTLRRDVDTLAQLDAAAALGLGPRTAALRPGRSSRPVRAP